MLAKHLTRSQPLFRSWATGLTTALALVVIALAMMAAPAPARADQGVQMASIPPDRGIYADMVVVDKTRRELHLMRAGFVFRTFRVALGSEPLGHKRYQGDGRTPEGEYVLDWWHPNSSFYKAIRVSYPNDRDRARANAMGKSPGGSIMIHGLPNGFDAAYVNHPHDDWTEGCIAVTNEEMDVIHAHVREGTSILILP